MQKFLAQFNGVFAPLDLIRLENYIFNLAEQMVEGYNGGSWTDVEVDAQFTGIAIPEQGGKHEFTCDTSFSNVSADAKTIGCAPAFIGVNHFWHARAASMSAEQNDKLEQFHFGFRDALLDSGKFNTSAFLSIID